MLEVTMTPDEAEVWCRKLPNREKPCPQLLDYFSVWGCRSPECIMCCEAHKRGRADEGSEG